MATHRLSPAFDPQARPSPSHPARPPRGERAKRALETPSVSRHGPRRLAVVASFALLAGCEYKVDSFDDAADANPGDRKCERSGAATTGNGLCTLRAAIMEANASAWADTVILPAGTYRLTLAGASGGALRISTDVKIQGSGAAQTLIDQDRAGNGVVQIDAGNVDIHHVTIQGGDAQNGGGVRIDGGTARMHSIVVRDNNAFTGGGGILVNDNGRAFLRHSTVSGNEAIGAFGGGIWNRGELWVYETAIVDNESNRAGGVRNDGNLNLRNVTVSGNRARSTDAGVGGISQNQFAVLYNVTVTNNRGNGNTESSFRGGGLQTSAGETSVVKNSIIAGNDGGIGPDDCVGSLTGDSKYNLIGDTTGCTIPSFLNTFKLNVSPQLAALASNGGPSQTHRLMAGSPAINAGYPFTPGGPAADACEGRDQRGVPRPQGGPCDLGAFEVTSNSAFVTGFVLVDAEANVDIRPLRHGDSLSRAALPAQLAVRATTSGVPGSVVFGLDATPSFRIENAAPYALGGDTAGDYAPVALAEGDHTLSATPFAAAGGVGAAGGAQTITFSVAP